MPPTGPWSHDDPDDDDYYDNDMDPQQDPQWFQHVDEIKRDSDYLVRFARKGEVNQLEQAFQAWRDSGESIPLLLPNFKLNPDVLTTRSHEDKTPSLIEVNKRNVRVTRLVFSHMLISDSPIDASAFVNLFQDPNTASAIIRFLYSQSDLITSLQSEYKKSTTCNTRTRPILIDNGDDYLNEMEMFVQMIGVHDPDFERACNEYIQQYQFPFFNSAGYIPINLEVIQSHNQLDSDNNTMPDDTTTIQFQYLNNESLFHHALRCNNLSAFGILLDICSRNFSRSSLVPALYETIQTDFKSDIAAWTLGIVRSHILLPSQRKVIHQQLLSHPITGKSIFDVLFQRVLTLQHFHHECELFSPQSYLCDNGSNNNNNDNYNNNNNNNRNANNFMIELRQIQRSFDEILLVSILIIWLTADLYSVTNNDKAKKFSQQMNARQGNSIDTATIVQHRMLELFQSFAIAATRLYTSIQHSTIAGGMSNTTFSPNPHTPITETKNVSVNYIQEYSISMSLHFLPYQRPQDIVTKFTQLPQNHIRLLKILLPRAPPHFIRVNNTTDPFPGHVDLFKTVCPQFVRDTRPPSKKLLPPPTTRSQQLPLIMSAKFLGTPTCKIVFSLSNSYPTDPAQAAQAYQAFDWCESNIKNFQSKRVLVFQTQLNDVQRDEIIPIILLNLHPIAIAQAVYLYTDTSAKKYSNLYQNPVFTLLLQQVVECLEPRQIKRFSIISNKDSIHLKALATKSIQMPSQIAAILCPTLIDFVYFCRHRSCDSTNEQAYYIQYICHMFQELKLVGKKPPNDFIKAISQDQYNDLNQLNQAAEKSTYIPYFKSTQLLTDACMKGQSDSSKKNLSTPANIESIMKEYIAKIGNGFSINIDGDFVKDEDNLQDVNF